MTPLWTENISILYEKRLFEIVPMKELDLNRKLNSLFRLSIFYAIIVYLVNKKEKTLMIPIGVGIFTIIISKSLKSNQIGERMVELQNADRKRKLLIEDVSQVVVLKTIIHL